VTGDDGSTADLVAWDRSAPVYAATVGGADDSFRRRFAPFLDRWLPGPFDVVLCHMVLMDVPTLDRLLADVAVRLSEEGVLVASILHPAFFGQQPAQDHERHRRVTGYLGHEERWVETFGGHRHYHRPLSWYVGRLRDAGLAVVDLDEPPSLPARDVPESAWTEHERWFASIPTMLSFAALRVRAG